MIERSLDLTYVWGFVLIRMSSTVLNPNYLLLKSFCRSLDSKTCLVSEVSVLQVKVSLQQHHHIFVDSPLNYVNRKILHILWNTYLPEIQNILSVNTVLPIYHLLESPIMTTNLLCRSLMMSSLRKMSAITIFNYFS